MNAKTKVAEKTARTRKVLREEDFKFPTEKQLAKEHEQDLRSISKATGAPRARASLAKGVDGRNSPNSAKAVADAAAKERATNKADKVAVKGKAKVEAKARATEKKEERKAERQSWKENRAYKVLLKPSEITAREGTWRRAMLDCVVGNKTTDAANDCMAKNKEFGKTHKIDWRWCANQGYISL
jgi:hypothetical protein